MTTSSGSSPVRPKVLIIDDDASFAQSLARSFVRRGYDVAVTFDVVGGIGRLDSFKADFAVVDLKMPGVSGLDAIKQIHEKDQNVRIVVLTGFASITTAVQAIKLGAAHYLPKPANAEDIIAAFYRSDEAPSTEMTERKTSIKNLEWERIHETLVETGFNISETARRLGMHRRTLARKLEKHRVS